MKRTWMIDVKCELEAFSAFELPVDGVSARSHENSAKKPLQEDLGRPSYTRSGHTWRRFPKRPPLSVDGSPRFRTSERTTRQSS